VKDQKGPEDYERYRRRLEELRAQGRISEKIYERLMKEFSGPKEKTTTEVIVSQGAVPPSDGGPRGTKPIFTAKNVLTIVSLLLVIGGIYAGAPYLKPQVTVQMVSVTAHTDTGSIYSTSRSSYVTTPSSSLGRPSAPKLISPRNQSVFNYYPRSVTFQWTDSEGAKPIRYVFELQFTSEGDFTKFGDWKKGGRTWPAGQPITDLVFTEYKIDWVGVQPGRWRVKAVNSYGESGWSEWYYFRFTA